MGLFTKRRKPKHRPDYRLIKADNMRVWGHNAFFLSDERMCMFGSHPRVGDVVLKDGIYYAITNKYSPMDPGDQHFLDLVALREPPAPSTYQPTIVDDLV